MPADHWLIGGLRTWLLAEGGPKLPEHCPWISELYILGGAPVAAQSDNRGAHFSRDREATLSAALWELAYNRAEVLNGQGKVIAAKLAGRVNDNRVTHGFDFDGAPQPSTILSTIQQALSTKRKE